jgi:hypothetical protein
MAESALRRVSVTGKLPAMCKMATARMAGSFFLTAAPIPLHVDRLREYAEKFCRDTHPKRTHQWAPLWR